MDDKQHPYWKQTLLAAPVFGAKALIGDLPRGAVEQAVERRLGGSRAPFKKLLSQGLRGRGGGRAIGGALGILTAPLYLRGIQLAGSKTKSDRAKGLALLGLSSSIFVGQKGLIEGYRSARTAGAGSRRALAKGGLLGLTRSIYKAPAALALGMSVAAGRNKAKRQGNVYTKFVTPALYGSAIGAVSRGVEDVVDQMASKGRPKGVKGFVRAIRRAGPAMGGGAAGGLLGGLVLSGVVDAAEKVMEKKSSIAVELAGLGLTHQTIKGALGYGKIGKFFAKTPGLRNLAEASNEANTRQLAIGIREGLAGKRDLGWRGGVLLGASYPELTISRSMGQNVGRMLRHLPPERRSQALSHLAKKVEQNPLLRTTPRGDPTPVLRYLPEAAARAIGSKPIYTPAKSALGRAAQEAWMKATLTGRGVRGGGLPGAGRSQAASTIRDILPSVGLTTAGVSLAAGLGPAAALPAIAAIPAGVLGAHMALGGVKGIGAHSKKIQEIGRQGMIRGVVSGLVPGLRKRPMSAKRFEQLTDTIVSPALGDVERLAASLGNAGYSALGKRLITRPAVQALGASRLKKARDQLPKKNLRNFLGGSALAGAGLAGIKGLSSGEAG
jgi:hypothetical protein